MDLELQFPLDDDGYLDRECPSCQRPFRWHHGPTDEAPENLPVAPEYYCPYCAAPAPVDEWFTTKQVETIQQAALGAVQTELGREFRAMSRRSRGVISYKAGRTVDPPSSLDMDPDHDYIAVASPCHPYEPIKIMDTRPEPAHCLICGSAFTY